MQSKAATVEEYLESLTPERRDAINAVRKVILKNLDKKYREEMQYGAIGYNVPLAVYPPGYHCTPNTPLPFAALASQKNHMSLYLMSVYCGCGADGDPASRHANWFREEWRKTGKKLDMGKSCIRFRKVDDLALDVIAQAVKQVPVSTYLKYIESAAASSKRAKKK